MNTDNPSQLRKHVEQMNRLFSTQKHVHPAYQILMEFGKDYSPANHCTHPALKNKLCFMNSFDGMNNDAFYCEGIATTSLHFPMDHAWLVDTTGQVIDPTWEDGQAYFGVEFEQDFMYEISDKTGYYGVFQSLYMLKMSPEACYEYLKTGVRK